MEQDYHYTKRHYLFILIFSIFLDLSIVDGFRVVIQKLFEIPEDKMHFLLWGNTFFLRIISSVLGTAVASFAIGTYLNKNYKIISLIATIPSIAIWTTHLGLGLWLISKGNDLDEIKYNGLILSAIILFSLPIVALWFSKLGNSFYEPQDFYSVFFIKWYHWTWIFILLLRNLFAIFLYFLVVLWKIDWVNSNNNILDIFSNNYLFRLFIVILIIILYISANYLYRFVVENDLGIKNKWKEIIFLIVLIFSYMIIYNFLFSA